MQTDGKATKGRKPSAATRERILAAARDLFSARGFKGTTTAEIARHAKVNEALIFRHFPAKSDLYTAILQAKLADEQITGILRAAECEKITPGEALRLVAERYLNCADREFLRLYYHSALEGHELAAGFYDQFVRRLITQVEDLIRRGTRSGEFREVEPRTTALAFTGMLRSYSLTRELFADHALPKSDAGVAEAFSDLFLKGLEKR